MNIPTGQTIAMLLEQLAAAEIPDTVNRISIFAHPDGGFYLQASVNALGCDGHGDQGSYPAIVNRTPSETLTIALARANEDALRKLDAGRRAAAEFGAYMPQVRA
jgi:hypothetical protein